MYIGRATNQAKPSDLLKSDLREQYGAPLSSKTPKDEGGAVYDAFVAIWSKSVSPKDTPGEPEDHL